MLSLEQVKLLETKVARTVEYVDKLSSENTSLRKKLETSQKRIDELEVLVSRFKEEQGRIEDGILSALDRLSQFETAIEKSLAARNKETKPVSAARDKPEKAPDNVQGPDKAKESTEKTDAEEIQMESVIPEYSAKRTVADDDSLADIQDPLESDWDSGDQPDNDSSIENEELENEELDIF